ncbi:tripartite tricarboxylate transporter substrate binding protein [Achromobacter aegrifaciens]|uniref:Bug family tripartite tricarboxylate transporter substrate binding protein n=1 Tax=Achromobacter aegrifaciens TaxID=1287736 RepID=UPI0027BA9718|nr:tripartite tricarboxylate transporter substrate binding protein [Achromobacter aegrifaciens]WLW60851.1 tripartite tricarboxylate transporter substrate binding protein [Achromobacter aegrifaciens]
MMRPTGLWPGAFARAAICMLATLPGLATAQSYPAKPVQLIVPFSAGGDADMAARNLAAAAQGLLGQPLVVVNKAGANGAIGSAAVKNAAPDGYTLLVGRIGSQVLLPALQPKTTPYTAKDFTYIGLLELNPVVCVVHPDSPYKTMGDLAQALKDRPGKLNYSHSGPATVQNLAPQLLLSSLGLKPEAVVNVPYKGGNEVALAVLSKDADFACNNLSSMTGILASGKLRALLTTTPERLAQFPDIPTARELGMPQLEAVIGWSGLFGPPGMSPEAVDKWAAVLKQISQDPKWIAGNANFGGIPHVLPPGETEKYVSQGAAIYADLVAKAGLQVN